MLKIAINGFGRIGRAAFRAATDPQELGERLRRSGRIDTDEVEVVAINDLADGETLANLLKYDSVYGTSSADIFYKDSFLVVNKDRIKLFAERDPVNLPWNDLGVDIALESTGVFADFEKAKAHIDAGAKKVIISANAKGDGPTVVLGTESAEDRLQVASHSIVSNASCTTNCIAPIMQILKDNFGITKSLMTTVHAYTSTQNLVDGPNEDPRRARAAALNIIPTTTGAARATGKVVSELEDIFDGISLRVPIACASLADIVALLEQRVSCEAVNGALKEASETQKYHGLIEFSEAPLVSSDIIGNSHSAVVDAPFTRIVGGNLVKILAWYDNEWAYACRLVELAQLIGREVS